jgi:hypothetical protein
MNLLILALGALEKGIELYNKLRERALQNQEMTQEQIDEMDAKVKEMFNQPHWQ